MKFFNKVKKAFKGFVNKIKSVPKGIIDTVRKVTEKIKPGVQNEKKKIIEKVRSASKAVTKGIKQGFEKIKGVFKKEKAPLFASTKPEDWVKQLDKIWNDKDYIYKVKVLNKKYLSEMNDFIISEYKRFLNS